MKAASETVFAHSFCRVWDREPPKPVRFGNLHVERRGQFRVVQTLYAQNKQLPLHADLSRFPPGYSTGERFYASEGPVGLAWLFLRAHAVIAASWGATDASTQQLMDSFYDSLNQGTTPDVALRNALSVLDSDGSFREAYCWAPC
jgi:hypothetical protein